MINRLIVWVRHKLKRWIAGAELDLLAGYQRTAQARHDRDAASARRQASRAAKLKKEMMIMRKYIESKYD